MPNDRPTLEEIRTVWRDVNIPAYALPKKDWFDRLDAAIRADERALLAPSLGARAAESERRFLIVHGEGPTQRVYHASDEHPSFFGSLGRKYFDELSGLHAHPNYVFSEYEATWRHTLWFRNEPGYHIEELAASRSPALPLETTDG